jgi:hypothetical protein
MNNIMNGIEVSLSFEVFFLSHILLPPKKRYPNLIYLSIDNKVQLSIVFSIQYNFRFNPNVKSYNSSIFNGSLVRDTIKT